MGRTRKSIIWVGIVSVITFILFFFQMQFVSEHIGLSLLAALIMATLTAVLATISYGYREFLQRRAFAAGKKQASDNLEAHQTRTVEIDLPYEAAFDLALDALKTLDNKNIPIPDDILVKMESILPRKQFLKVLEVNREMGNIRAGLRGKTIGIPDFWDFSRIDIQLQRIDNNTTRIQIESKNNIPGEIYDLGKNLHYVNEIALFLRRESQQMNAESHLEDESNDSDEENSIGQALQDSEADSN